MYCTMYCAAVEMIQGLLRVDINRRLTACEARNQPWMSEVGRHSLVVIASFVLSCAVCLSVCLWFTNVVHTLRKSRQHV